MEWHDWLSVALGIIGIPGLASGWIPILKSRQKLLTPIGLFLAVIAVVFAVTSAPEVWLQSPKAEVKITSPLNNALITPEISVKGYSTKELGKNQHLYIVVEYGGRWWPQYSEVTIGYSQTNRKYEFNTPANIGKDGDTGKSFTVRAILVDSAIHQHFQSWLQQQTTTEKWQGIPITEANQWGERELCDSIAVTRQ